MSTQLVTPQPQQMKKRPLLQKAAPAAKPPARADQAGPAKCLKDMAIVFKAKAHSYFSNKDVQVIGPEIMRLAGDVTSLTGVKPATVVAAATEEASPLHRYFEWDNEKAAHAHRLQQARMMLNAVEFEVIEGDQKKTRLPAFESLRVVTASGTGTERRYFSLPQITSSASMTASYVEQAKDELSAWRTRYKKCEKIAEFRRTFDRVLKAIDQVVQAKAPRGRKKAA